jgi:hypothetical protein
MHLPIFVLDGLGKNDVIRRLVDGSNVYGGYGDDGRIMSCQVFG